MSRGNPHPHKYKFGKQTEKISFKDFSERIDQTRFVDPLRDKSFLVLLSYLGCRIGELLKLKRDRIIIKHGMISFDLEVFKGGDRPKPLKLPISFPYMELFLEYLRQTKTERVFMMSYSTGWRTVKRAFPRKYPHYFRLNRATHMLDDPETTIPELKAWFGWKRVETIAEYIGHSDRYIDKGIKRIEKDVRE